MKFEMYIKGKEYRTTDGKIQIVKSQKRVCTFKSDISSMFNKYSWVTSWLVTGFTAYGDCTIYEFRYLADAKHFVEMKLTRRLGELKEEMKCIDNSKTNESIAEQIAELRKVLGCESKPRKNYRPARVVNR